MSIEKSYQNFLDAFYESTKNVGEQYFKLRVGYSGEPIYRERAYCYELYHQLRISLGEEFPYVLSGEIDKRGHEIIAGTCGEIKPDFLVHQPGNMSTEANLVIIEVKQINCSRFDFIDDLNKLNCMTGIEDGYYRAIMLLYGDEKMDGRFREKFKELCSDNIEKIELIHHYNVGDSAVRIEV